MNPLESEKVEMLLEAIQHDFKAFGEGLDFVKLGVADLQQRMGRLESGFERHELRLGALEQNVGDLRDEMSTMREELRAEMRAGQEQLRAEMRAGQEQLRAEMRAGQEQLRAEVSTMRDDIRSEIHTLRNDVNTVLHDHEGRIVALEQSRK
ncbi:MAG: hypothetical protein ACM3ZA_11925 [Bacillota bacterium]